MAKVVLTHFSNRKGCVGKPGDVVEVSDSVAQDLVDRRGGRRTETAAADPAPETTAAGRGRRRRAETATDARAEAAETPED